MKLSKIFVVTILGVFFLTSNVIAVPSTLSDLLGPGYDSYTDTGAEAVVLTDTDGVDDDATAFLFMELAGFAPSLTFGIYDYTKENDIITIGNTLEIFNGNDKPITSTVLHFDLQNKNVTNQTTGASANIGTTFGFYLTTPQDRGYTYYSHTDLNIDSYDHLVMFDTSDNTKPNLFGSDVVLAWEDLLGGGDNDYNDFVVGITDVAPAPVPEPATMLLLGTGLIGIAGFRKKRIVQKA